VSGNQKAVLETGEFVVDGRVRRPAHASVQPLVEVARDVQLQLLVDDELEQRLSRLHDIVHPVTDQQDSWLRRDCSWRAGRARPELFTAAGAQQVNAHSP
jgi:hypothetical protein